MNLLSVDGLSKSYTRQRLFENISFGVDAGQKVGIVASNGSGKTTLLNVLHGSDNPDSGTFTWRKGIKIAMLPQVPVFSSGITVSNAVLNAADPAIAAVLEYEKAMHDPQGGHRIEKAMEEVERLGAWDIEARIAACLSRLEILNLTEMAVDNLSGGQKKRVALARALISEPDFLLLDEPTNHLDLPMIEWLEGELANPKITLLMVTHDRYFLDRICTEILELEYGCIYRHKGNFTNFLLRRAERMAGETATAEKARALLRTEYQWLYRQPKARGTKARTRIGRIESLEGAAETAPQKAELLLETRTPRLGGKILELKAVEKSFGNLKILCDFTHSFKKGERMGITGRNGTGKTTLLKLLTGELTPDKGTVDRGETVKFGCFSQEGLPCGDGKLVIETVKEKAQVIDLGGGRTVSPAKHLETFLFPPEMHYIPVSRLSGGERKRLELLTMLVQAPNFILLDEPTNDLDILTLGVLEAFLDSFEGCIVMISHDRYFLDKLATHVLVFKGNGEINDHHTKSWQYSISLSASPPQVVRSCSSRTEAILPADAFFHQAGSRSNLVQPAAAAAKPLTFRENRELIQIEKRLAELDETIGRLSDEINSGRPGYEAMASLASELENFRTENESLSERWIELSERNEATDASGKGIRVS